MNRLILVAALLAASCAPGAAGNGPRFRLSANPSEVIAAELGFAQRVQTKGQWTAFRDTAAPDAELFAPQRVKAAEWLKGRADPVVPVTWQPLAVWSSCDGSYAVTRGAWQGPASSGDFATIWQRQSDGGYKWVLDMSLVQTSNSPPPEMVAAKIADCAHGATIVPWSPPPTGTDAQQGFSDDRTLQWSSSVAASGERLITALIWNGTSFDEALRIGG